MLLWGDAFSAVVAIGRLTAEISLEGFGARILTGGIFLAGLWLALPAALRAELRSGLGAKLRTWAR